MPSLLLGNQSGGQLIYSGAVYSGFPAPVGGVQLRWAANASGNAYVALSGNMHITSGNLNSSGLPCSGYLDGMLLTPGDSYFVPKIGVGYSGMPSIYAMVDAPASGQGRMYFELL